MVLTRVVAAVIIRSSTTAAMAEAIQAGERRIEKEEKGSLDGVMAALEGATK